MSQKVLYMILAACLLLANALRFLIALLLTSLSNLPVSFVLIINEL